MTTLLSGTVMMPRMTIATSSSTSVNPSAPLLNRMMATPSRLADDHEQGLGGPRVRARNVQGDLLYGTARSAAAEVLAGIHPALYGGYRRDEPTSGCCEADLRGAVVR